MTQDDVLELFREQAATLGEVQSTQNDIVLSLAQIMADSKKGMLKEHFDELVHIGAVMYQEGLGQFRARLEVAAMMEKSLQDQNDDHNDLKITVEQVKSGLSGD